MQFTQSFITFAVMALAIASPLPKKKVASTSVSECGAAAATSAAATSVVATAAAAATTAAAAATTAAAAKAATGASVLTAAAYNDFQISAGTAGDAKAKAAALFAALPTDLSAVTASDLKIVKGIHDAAENAEVGAFNPAIAAASGAAATALQNGKIQNKVLKLTAEVLGIQIDTAQGKTGGDLAAEQAKLANNIKLDTAAAGQASTAVPFDATS